MKIKTTSKSIEPIWDELNEVFLNFVKFTPKVKKKLESLGFEVSHIGKHPKLYIKLDKTYVITLCTSPSDVNTGRQILREIRKIYENYDRKLKENKNEIL